MCKLLITTTKYSGCPTSCNKDEEDIVTTGCSHFAATGQQCANPTKEYLGNSRSRAQCPTHKDEGYGDRNNR
ncbi:hypothetical protein FOMA001_g19867 [Fusarium oxysporum f. sp. matthiolae]|nr:hypothetical protein FOMA001_g19867 [Fusarium oxysporum f. sp. matthiolae]